VYCLYEERDQHDETADKRLDLGHLIVGPVGIIHRVFQVVEVIGMGGWVCPWCASRLGDRLLTSQRVDRAESTHVHPLVCLDAKRLF
jgi:hypothetical protein